VGPFLKAREIALGTKVCVIMESAIVGEVLWSEGKISDRNIGRMEDKINFALCSMLIYKETTKVPVEIWALSPSQYECLLAKQQLKELLPRGGIESRISDRDPNHTAIVLAVLIGQEQIILGADLLESGNDRLGWSAVVSNRARPQLSATLFKIPHHGSATAHQRFCSTKIRGSEAWMESLRFLPGGVRGRRKTG
jgi:hypothetical protein